VQNLVSNVLARVAVPLFYLISGFLFFRDFELSTSCIKRKLERRFRTLLLPYLIWNAGNLLFLFILQSIPRFADYFSGERKRIADYGAYDYLNAFLGFDGFPIAYQFWFIRDLMVMVLLAPFCWLIVKSIPRLGVVLLLVPFLLETPVRVLNLSFFFYMGALAASKGLAGNSMDSHGRKTLILYAILAVLDAALMGWSSSLACWVGKPTLFLGVLSAWYLAGRAEESPKVKQALTWLVAFAFFVYAAHEPLLFGLRKIMYKALRPSNSLEITGVYLCAPITIICLTMVLGYVLRKLAPGVYKVMTGGR
jgi:fucose 4-O-acetylase-like acetyltransferase